MASMDLWFPWRVDHPIFNLIPVNTVKEDIILDILKGLRPVPWIFLKESADKVLTGIGDHEIEVRILILNPIEHLLLVL